MEEHSVHSVNTWGGNPEIETNSSSTPFSAVSCQCEFSVCYHSCEKAHIGRICCLKAKPVKHAGILSPWWETSELQT